jgi:hypothetical protein
MKAYKQPAPTNPRVGDHHQDSLNAVREGREAGSPFEYGGRLTEIALLGAIAIRFPGQELLWNTDEAKFTNLSEANAWLNPPYRQGWSL